MIIPEKQNIDLEVNTILEVKSGILILEAKIKNKKIIVGILKGECVINLAFNNY